MTLKIILTAEVNEQKQGIKTGERSIQFSVDTHQTSAVNGYAVYLLEFKDEGNTSLPRGASSSERERCLKK